MTRRVNWKNGFMAVLAISLGLLLSGCTSSGCCDAPDPCEPSCSPCDPCAGGGPRPSGLPEEAKAGEAWCRVLVPAKYEDYEEKRCCKPAGTKRDWIEPVYEEREKKVCCTPARCKQTCIPAEFKDESEQVQTCPARTVWKKIPCEPDQLKEGEKQGDCWKLVEIPAQFKTVTRRVCTKPASTKTEQIPPVFKTVMEKVLVTPGSWKCTPIPAEFSTVTKRRMVEPCRWEWRHNTACDVPEAAGDDDGDAKADAEEAPILEDITTDEVDLGDAPAGK